MLKSVVKYPVKLASGEVVDCASYNASYALVQKGAKPLPVSVVKVAAEPVVAIAPMYQEAA